MTIDQLQSKQTAIANLLPELTLCHGVGDLGDNKACTMAAINLALGKGLTDVISPCISPIVRSWVIQIQDAMPEGMMNGRSQHAKAWRAATPLIAGTAYMDQGLLLQVVMDHMWKVLGLKQVIDAPPNNVVPKWKEMLELKTVGAARAAAAVADTARAAAAYAAADAAAHAAAVADTARAAAAYAAYAAVAARAYTVYAAYAAHTAAVAAARAAAVAYGAAVADAVAYGAATADADKSIWTQINPAAVLMQLTSFLYIHL